MYKRQAVYSAEGKAQIKETIGYYMTNAKIMKEGLEATGLKVYGGVNAPYLWVDVYKRQVELSLIEEASYRKELHELIRQHYLYTGSKLARILLDNWNQMCIRDRP